MPKRPRPADGAAEATSLLHLPDCVLSRVAAELAPAGGLFSLAATCTRLRALCAAPDITTIHVDPQLASNLAGGRRDPRPPRARAVCATLADALACARPGDTITLADGVHACPETTGLVIDKAVRIQGGGDGAEIAAPSTAAAGAPPPTITLTAQGQGVIIINVTLHAAPAAPALLHVAGAATLDACRVRAAPCALGHLHPPLISAAVAAPPGAPPEAVAVAPGGRLTIRETIVRGSRGGAAVRAVGSGRVGCVRGVPLPRGGVLLWAVVDAASLDNDDVWELGGCV